MPPQIYSSFFPVSPSFLTAHIWACPPSEGDDYIFHCHPAEQKVPKPKRLVDWYKKMLDKGKSDSVVYEYRVSTFRLCACTYMYVLAYTPFKV